LVFVVNVMLLLLLLLAMLVFHLFCIGTLAG
jgi:hypothetical protein